jgi:hypothetical protein
MACPGTDKRSSPVGEVSKAVSGVPEGSEVTDTRDIEAEPDSEARGMEIVVDEEDVEVG